MATTTAALIRENTDTKASKLQNSEMCTSFQIPSRCLCSTDLRSWQVAEKLGSSNCSGAL